MTRSFTLLSLWPTFMARIEIEKLPNHQVDISSLWFIQITCRDCEGWTTLYQMSSAWKIQISEFNGRKFFPGAEYQNYVRVIIPVRGPLFSSLRKIPRTPHTLVTSNSECKLRTLEKARAIGLLPGKTQNQQGEWMIMKDIYFYCIWSTRDRTDCMKPRDIWREFI